MRPKKQRTGDSRSIVKQPAHRIQQLLRYLHANPRFETIRSDDVLVDFSDERKAFNKGRAIVVLCPWMPEDSIRFHNSLLRVRGYTTAPFFASADPCDDVDPLIEALLLEAPGVGGVGTDNSYYSIVPLAKMILSAYELKENEYNSALPRLFGLSPDPSKTLAGLRGVARNAFEDVADAPDVFTEEPSRVIASLLSLSRAEADVLLSQPEFANLVGIDCEMVRVGPTSLEVCRVGIVRPVWSVENKLEYEILLDTLVLPESPVLDYLTKFSGVTQEMLAGVNVTLENVWNWMRTYLPASTVFVGHSLENDFTCLRLFHDRVIDTSVVFPRSGGNKGRGRVSKNSLKFLTRQLLGHSIQDTAGGHCAVVDAIMPLELVLLHSVRKMYKGRPLALCTAGQAPFPLAERFDKAGAIKVLDVLAHPASRYSPSACCEFERFPDSNSVLARCKELMAAPVSEDPVTKVIVCVFRDLELAGLRSFGVFPEDGRFAYAEYKREAVEAGKGVQEEIGKTVVEDIIIERTLNGWSAAQSNLLVAFEELLEAAQVRIALEQSQLAERTDDDWLASLKEHEEKDGGPAAARRLVSQLDDAKNPVTWCSALSKSVVPLTADLLCGKSSEASVRAVNGYMNEIAEILGENDLLLLAPGVTDPRAQQWNEAIKQVKRSGEDESPTLRKQLNKLLPVWTDGKRSSNSTTIHAVYRVNLEVEGRK